MKQSIRSWHAGKILLLWFFALFILVTMLRDTYGADFGLDFFFWAVLCSPVIVITWIWFGGRERDENANQVETTVKSELPLNEPERKIADAFLRILDEAELLALANCAYPQTTGRPASPLRALIEAEQQRRRGQ